MHNGKCLIPFIVIHNHGYRSIRDTIGNSPYLNHAPLQTVDQARSETGELLDGFPDHRNDRQRIDAFKLIVMIKVDFIYFYIIKNIICLFLLIINSFLILKELSNKATVQ